MSEMSTLLFPCVASLSFSVVRFATASGLTGCQNLLKTGSVGGGACLKESTLEFASLPRVELAISFLGRVHLPQFNPTGVSPFRRGLRHGLSL